MARLVFLMINQQENYDYMYNDCNSLVLIIPKIIHVNFSRLFQTTEEELFGNKAHGAAMEEFLQLLGERVQLKDFKGWVNFLNILIIDTIQWFSSWETVPLLSTYM